MAAISSELNLLPTDPAYQATFAREEQVLAGIRDGVIADPLMDLIKVDAQFWRKFSMPTTKLPNLVSNDTCSLLKNSWVNNPLGVDIGSRLLKLNKYVTPNSIVAGGAIFSILFGLPVNDVDIFFVGAEPSQATEIIHDQIAADDVERISRSVNALTLKVHSTNFDNDGEGEVQYILRLYKSISEVIHGFDVDCCCLAYDGTSVWMTPRAHYALSNGYNTLTKERMSPSYEYRLLKYAYRGMPIMVPGFDNQSWLEGKGLDISKMTSRELRDIIKDELMSKRHGFLYLVVMAQIVARYPRGAAKMLHINERSTSDYSGSSNAGHIFGIRLMEDVLGNRYDDFIAESRGIDDSGITITNSKNKVTKEIDGKMTTITTVSIVSYVTNGEDSDNIFVIPDDVYDFVERYYSSYPPREIAYKVVRPGEQATGSFHKIVLNDPSVWWKGL